MPAMSPFDLAWSQFIVPTLNAFALTGSLTGIVIAVGLLVGRQGTLEFFRRVNRKVSMRQALKPLEVPRTFETPGRRHPLLGVVFLLGGAYASVVLLTQLNGARAIAALGMTTNPVSAEVLLDTLRWFLIAGGVAAVVFGVMLLFFPGAWQALEGRANHWYSTRRMYTGGDDMHMGLDLWVERFPRAAGVILGALSLISAGAFAVLVFGRH